MLSIVKITTLGVIASISLSAIAFAQSGPTQNPPKELTAFLNVSLIDGTGAALQKGMGVLIQEGRIKTIALSDDLKANLPQGIKTIDGSGQYLLPGLIDSHVHMATVPNAKQAKAYLRRYLYSGITSVRDMAGDTRALSDLARNSRLKNIPSPDLYFSALMAGPTFFKDPRPASSAQGEKPGYVPWMQAITPDTDMKTAVALSRGTWATGVKIYANLAPNDVKRIADEARHQGIKTWAHSMVFPTFPSEVIEAGVDVISHVCRLAFEISKEKPTEYHHKIIPNYDALNPRDDRIKALYKTMVDKNMILDATIRVYTEAERRREAEPKDKQKPVACPSSFAARLTKFAFENGVEIATGTDGQMPFQAAYPELHEELEHLTKKVGMPPLSVIRSATLVGAMALGLDDEKGSIEVGKKADLVLISKNPLKDISNLRSVVLTMKSGTIYNRNAYNKIEKDEVQNDK